MNPPTKITADPATLPPLDLPVWMWLPDINAWIIGCRSEDEEGWQWGHCYEGFWMENGTWKTDMCDTDDYHPTAWMALPEPWKGDTNG